MNSVFRSLRVLAFAVCALVLLAGVATQAQTFRGTILGSVSDSSGAAVPGATVTIKNLDTGLTRTVATQEDGSYAAPELPLGNYSVTVEKSGFKSGVVTGVKVEVSKESRADVTLQPGQIAQTVEVQGEELPMVESTSNTLGGIVESKVAANLPVNGRDYQKLILLVPGASAAPDGISDSPGSYGTLSVNGARGRSNNYLLDGTDMNDGYRNDPAINEAGVFGTPATILPIEAIAEVHVESNFEAEYGRSAGAAINIVTKSGTNDLHGSAFDYFRNTDLNARNYFNPSGQTQQPFHLNQFGGDLGGPIFKDKTFFFVDYEGVRETGAEASPACVPTAADISANAPTPGDLSSINKVIQNLLALNPWPQPTNSNDCYANGGAPNANLATPFSNRVDNGIVKIDHNFNKDNLLTGRYYIGDSTQLFPLALTGGGLLPNYNTQVPTRVQMIAISYVSVLSPSVVNEARVGWNRFAEGFFPEDRDFDPSSIGLDTVGPGTPNNGNPYNFGLPVMTVGSPTGSGLAQLGADKADPRQRVDTNWHYIDNVSWKHGKHDIKAGYEFRRTSISQIFNRTFRGKLEFSSLQSFLMGIPDDGGTQGTGDTNRNTFQNSHAIYLQDSYRATRRFTLNLGLRYDYFGIIQEKQGLFTNLDPTTGLQFYVNSGRLYQPDYKNVAPRVSAAWDVTGNGRTVVRAGYGIFYDAFSQDLFMGHLPFSSSFDPGPAYSGLPGVGQISFALPLAQQFQAGVPVFGPSANYSPMTDEFGVDPNIRAPYMENFNVNVQQQLTRKMVLQVGYVGSQGHKLFDFRDLNQPTQAEITASDLGCDCTNTVPGPLNPSRNYIYWMEAAANSSYNSLQTSLRVDNWHGLTTSVNYVWSHSIDNASDGEDYVPNAAQPTDSTNVNTNRGNSNFDIRNRFTWNFIYQVPDAKDSRYKLIRNGWGLNGIVTVQSGAPFHMILESSDFDGAGTSFAKPDVIAPIHYNFSDPNNFLDLSSFAVPCTPMASGFDGTAATCEPGTRHFGNEGRNSLIGPNYRQFDFSIYKNTSITERVKMELRFEAYNIFNHPNFASPLWPNFLSDPTVTGVAPAGQSSIFATNGHLQGTLPLTVTGDVGIGYPVLGGGGQRSLQIAAKFTF
jgi:outer membrane receptor protein involved in Fe transport